MKARWIHIILSALAGVFLYFFLDYATSNDHVCQLVIVTAPQKKDVLQVFYEANKEFTPEVSFFTPVESGEKKELVFDVPQPDSLGRLRIDLGSTLNAWKVYEIKLRSQYGEWKIVSDSIAALFDPVHEIGAFTPEDDFVQVVTSGTDAYMVSDFTLAEIIQSIGKKNPWMLRNVGMAIFMAVLLFLFLRYSHKPHVTSYTASLQTLFIFLFVVCISWPWIGSLFPGLTGHQDKKDQRKEVPSFSFRNTDVWMKEYTRYFENNFAGRNELITLNGYLAFKLFHSSALPHKVMVGKDKWLFSREEGIIDDVQHNKPFTQQELADIQGKFRALGKYCAMRNIKLYVLILPNKYTVYPEHLPSRFKVKNAPSRREQVVEMLSADVLFNGKVLDPTPYLLDTKKNAEVFYRYDTHWNFQGGFVGYTKLMELMAKDFPMVAPHSFTHYQNRYKVAYDGDLARSLGLEYILPNNEWVPVAQFKSPVHDGAKTEYVSYNSPYEPVFREHPDTSLPRMIMFRDSYANLLMPFVSEHFERSVYLWMNVVLNEAVEKEKPDALVFEVVEDKLHLYIQQNIVE